MIGGPARQATSWGPVTDVGAFLLAYDQQLRTDAETPSAIAVARLGSLRLARLSRAQGFVSYPHPYGDEAEQLAQLVGQVLDHFREGPEVTEVEWKTRGHDRAPGLHESLLDNAFGPQEPESIMIGRAQLLCADVALPLGVTLRQVSDEDDVWAMVAMQDKVFKRAMTDETARGLLRRLAAGDGMELWVAEAEDQIVAAGRLDPVPGTDFAGIWGGATLEAWRGRGIYRALTAARARSALAVGKTLIHSDSTGYSRPILERSGFVKVSTTTPYIWRR